MKVKKLCLHCLSDDIVVNSHSSWDVENQEWKTTAIYDNYYCHDCGEEFTEADEFDAEG